jgi:uncharacterized membrane protein
MPRRVHNERVTMMNPGLRFLCLTGALLAAVGCSAVLPPGFGQSSPAPGASAAPAGGAGVVSLKADVAPILKNHCAQCHSGPGASAGLQMFDAGGNAQHATLKARMGDMVGAIKSGYMPLGKPSSVPADQVQKLDDWNKAGGPDN